ncbi:hypothetical protein [Desertivirga brevis]|nr:hypothetical protein [Pedobacter sp. SYSU D00873]
MLNQKISAIKSEKPMLEQRAEIVETFKHVAGILTRMTDNKNKKLE